MIRQWGRELLMGARMAAAGGRAGWSRTLLTAVGVGLGVTVLLLAASVPTAMSASSARTDARQHMWLGGDEVAAGERTLVLADAGTEFRDKRVWGRLVQPDGEREEAVRPPGVAELPAPGEMLVSPALRELLGTAAGALLAERFDGARVVGTIGPEGLEGPREYAFYLGSDELTAHEGSTYRVAEFGVEADSGPLDPVLVLLVVVILVVLLMPIAVFIATAVRFGGESRDRRLAALRLVGADVNMTRRIAAGEALFGSLLGLVIGAGVFLAARSFAGGVELFGNSVYPGDMTPAWPLAVLIAILVPVSAVAVTLLALRGVAIGPLGVFREGTDRGRRLWWRLVVSALGTAVLVAAGSKVEGGTVSELWIATGIVLVLIGITSLLPWLVERLVSRMRGGPLSWQLATRRLQLNSGMAARAVSGVTVAVAGAVALQMLFSTVEARDSRATGQDPSRAQVMAEAVVSDGAQADAVLADFAATEGVRSSLGFVTGHGVSEETEPDESGYLTTVMVTVGDCATLRQLVRTGPCADGDVYVAAAPDEESGALPAPGERIDLQGAYEVSERGTPRWWTVPDGAQRAESVLDPVGWQRSGVFATPAALDVALMRDGRVTAMLRTEPGAPDVLEHVRNTAGVTDPSVRVMALVSTRASSEFASIRSGLLIGSLIVMLLIAASMIVSTLEQLRDRKRQLSVLVAFGTRRSTLGASVLWQTAIPVVLGLLLAAAGGTGLGVLLLDMVGESASDWLTFLPLAGAGLGMIALVTLASLPSLWRLMRPDGLRTE
ncbi:FtsX-like permease family protein [Streptomyces sp. TRM 70351]|uniref:FtsX-like permease family protein n=1 Tax=Streptomyces sp. TRM 70351 TaxID=3116552 RepID=UPI002E7B1C4F|nr:FtsX-like permease family protein [Streptomyces sp. TRM 70351]MEE1927783.1 FtsX-like permease family protein [Streptomyces sp. TRM 70351]